MEDTLNLQEWQDTRQCIELKRIRIQPKDMQTQHTYIKMKKREVNKIVITKTAQKRIDRNQCPGCGKHKSQWSRRTDWRCCSTQCTSKYVREMVIYGWAELRLKAFVRDNWTCAMCGTKPTQKIYEVKEGLTFKAIRSTDEYEWRDTNEPDASQLIGDHIIPISIGGEEFDINNVQTLCITCNKVKTRADMKDIAAQRRLEKHLARGQLQL